MLFYWLTIGNMLVLESILMIFIFRRFSMNLLTNYSMSNLRGWITKTIKNQIFQCRFVTVILFGTMSESFWKIVGIVLELRALVWGWNVAPKQAFYF